MTSATFLDDRKRLVAGFARAVKAAKVPHVVFLSSVGAQHESGTGPIRSVAEGERVLKTTGAALTVVRAAYFVDNWAGVLGAAKADGVLPTFVPASLTFPQVATSDIGAVAARTLLEGPRGVRVIELAGPVDVSAEDVAAVLTRVLGRPVKPLPLPLEAVVPTFTQYGINPAFAELFREMYEGIISGRVDFEKRGTEFVRGTTSLEQTLRALAGVPA